MDCYFAKEHVSIDQYGRFRPCCNWSFTGETPLTYQNNSVEEYVNSEFKNNIVNTLAKNSWPAGCAVCEKHERNGAVSLRTERIKPIKDVEIKFGNLCNLGCYMCTSDKSSVLYKTFSDMIEQGLGDDRIREDVEDYESKLNKFTVTAWYDNPDKIDDLATYAATRERIRFTGGEPTVNTYLRQFLETLSSINTEIQLRITTNGMILPSALLNLLGKFKRVELTFSIDGIGKYNEYMRWPSDWNKISNNFIKAVEYENIDVDINTVVSVLNVHLLDDIIEWGQEHGAHQHIFLPVHEPDVLQPGLAAQWQKDIFEQTYKKYENNSKIKMDKCKNFVHLEQSTQLLTNMQDYLDRLDKQRNTDWRKVFKL